MERRVGVIGRIISIHALLAESDALRQLQSSLRGDFYPRSPCGERHTWARGSRVTYVISIHALLAESDKPTTRRNNKHNIFLSTLSLRRATTVNIQRPSAKNDFYPRSPCGERQILIFPGRLGFLFLSTLSLRRATLKPHKHSGRQHDFYPRSPCGERRSTTLTFPGFGMISIHALLAESDSSRLRQTRNIENFYPRSPCGERRLLTVVPKGQYSISIHALLAESDRPMIPTTPPAKRFLSTLSLRRATGFINNQNAIR